MQSEIVIVIHDFKKALLKKGKPICGVLCPLKMRYHSAVDMKQFLHPRQKIPLGTALFQHIVHEGTLLLSLMRSQHTFSCHLIDDWRVCAIRWLHRLHHRRVGPGLLNDWGAWWLSGYCLDGGEGATGWIRCRHPADYTGCQPLGVVCGAEGRESQMWDEEWEGKRVGWRGGWCFCAEPATKVISSQDWQPCEGRIKIINVCVWERESRTLELVVKILALITF